MGDPSGGGPDDGSATGDRSAATDAGPAATADPSAVAVALDEYSELAHAVESALAGRSDVVASGIPLGLIPSILAARERSDDAAPWRIACRSGVVEALGRALRLGTAVAEAVAVGSIDLRTADTVQPMVFATPGRADAVAGPLTDPTLVSDPGGPTAGAVARATATRFEAATPAVVDLPSRTRLLATAHEVLDDRFAADLAGVLDGLEHGELGRTGVVTDRTLLVALAARHDLLFRDLGRWVDGDGGGGGDQEIEADADSGSAGERAAVAPSQELTDDRRALEVRGLIESVKVPMGPGRPNLRLRATDESLLRARPEEVLDVLRGQFALPPHETRSPQRESDGGGRRPVWDR